MSAFTSATGGPALKFLVSPRNLLSIAARPTLDETLSATVLSRGVDAAVAQYQALAAARSARYIFNEDRLNDLGYEVLRSRRYADAIRIFQMNVQAYPQSGNTYDSLGESYMDAGDTVLAVQSYRESLLKNPQNQNAVVKLGILQHGG